MWTSELSYNEDFSVLVGYGEIKTKLPWLPLMLEPNTSFWLMRRDRKWYRLRILLSCALNTVCCLNQISEVLKLLRLIPLGVLKGNSMGPDISGSAVQRATASAAAKGQLLGAIRAGPECVQLYICTESSKGTFLMMLRVCFWNAVQRHKTDPYLLTQCRAA